MSKKTRQEIFDFVWDEMTKQGKPSRDERSGRCLYRGPNGTKCAVGFMIPDEVANGPAKFRDVTSAMNYEEFKKALIDFGVDTDSDMPFIRELQIAHDEASRESGVFIKNFYAKMNWLAGYFGLNKRTENVN